MFNHHCSVHTQFTWRTWLQHVVVHEIDGGGESPVRIRLNTTSSFLLNETDRGYAFVEFYTANNFASEWRQHTSHISSKFSFIENIIGVRNCNQFSWSNWCLLSVPICHIITFNSNMARYPKQLNFYAFFFYMWKPFLNLSKRVFPVVSQQWQNGTFWVWCYDSFLVMGLLTDDEGHTYGI